MPPKSSYDDDNNHDDDVLTTILLSSSGEKFDNFSDSITTTRKINHHDSCCVLLSETTSPTTDKYNNDPYFPTTNTTTTLSPMNITNHFPWIKNTFRRRDCMNHHHHNNNNNTNSIGGGTSNQFNGNHHIIMNDSNNKENEYEILKDIEQQQPYYNYNHGMINHSDDDESSTPSKTTKITTTAATQLPAIIGTSTASISVAPTIPNDITTTANATTTTTTTVLYCKLLFGASGIYSAYLFYGHVQEDLFLYTSPLTGTKYQFAWLLQTLESFAIVTMGMIVLLFQTHNQQQNNKNHPHRQQRNYYSSDWYSSMQHLPKKQFFQAGASQVLSKTFTSLALAAGLSFPVCTLAKSAKIVPVMVGQFVLGGVSKYSIRDYLFAFLLVTGTAILSLNTGSGGGNHHPNHIDGEEEDTLSPASASSMAGVLWILASLVMDGFTAGLQKRILKDTAHAPPSTLHFLLLTNISMGLIALFVAIILPTTMTISAVSSTVSNTLLTTTTTSNELMTGIRYLMDNPVCCKMVFILCCCSVVGQSFIFFIITHFDPLVCSTITTTRKILSVLWSILTKGHVVSTQGQMGIALAVSGLMLEVHGKSSSHGTKTKGKKSIS